MGKLIYIMGKSSSGKDTVNKLIKEKTGMKSYVMYTTRPIRDGEQNGVDYHYITDEKMQELNTNGKVIESRTYQTVAGPWTYATIKDEQLDEKEDIIILGTLESYNQMKEYFGKESTKKLLPVYIEIDEQERRKRALKREQTQKVPKLKEMERRLAADNIDFSEEKLLEAGIAENQRFKNYDLEKCVQEIINYIERNKSFKDMYKVEQTPTMSNKYECKNINTKEREEI